MKTITYEDFVSFKPCWLNDEEKRIKHAEQLARYRKMRDEWSALDILRLDEVDAEDRMWLVLREELIDTPILHEFACRCAERALSRIDKPDERSVAAIEAKRKWMRGEISDDEMAAARDASWAAAKAASWTAAKAAAWTAAKDAAWTAASAAAWAAERAAERASEWAAARDAECAEEMAAAMATARSAACAAALDAASDEERYSANDAEREWQIAELMRMLKGAHE